MKKIIIYLIPILFFVSCQKNQNAEPLADEKKATTGDFESAPLTADDIPHPSEIYVQLNQILDKAMERMSAAQTTDEVVEVANWYYDEYWALADKKGKEWTTAYTQAEQQVYGQRDKEFVTLLRSQYISAGGTKEELRKLLHDLMIKCMQYDTALKAKQEEEVEN